jgi:Tol biopolymer transport system component
MKKTIFFNTLVISLLGLACSSNPQKPAPASVDTNTSLITNVRQLTFDGKRAGEGYFSADGKQIIFQSEREPNNPFYQIYLKNLETGDLRRISPGTGKTTCSWIHPSGKKVLFSSTHQDPKTLTKMRDEIEIRKKGTVRSYSWDFDENYDIYEMDLKTAGYKNLTKTKGYDAESSWSPDGQWIAFSSDRHAYMGNLSDAEKAAQAKNPSALAELYIMKADGSEVKRLTSDIGYDGGPFFSNDGKKIIWRKFSADGQSAEVYTMNIDGSDVRQITRLKSLSWAPYFHPSRDYIIFASALLGHQNFELFIVRADGQGDPVRVTDFPKFDGLPVFTPDGHGLAWSSQRSWDGSSQLFMAAWNDVAARKALGLPATTTTTVANVIASVPGSIPEIKKHVEYLSSPDLEGRLTGSRGEELATQYVADQFKALGLKAYGQKNTYFTSFTYPSGVELGTKNTLEGETPLVLNIDWRPLVFSSSEKFETSDIVLAGYGIVSPGNENSKPLDAYAGLEVKDKWVMVFRYMPEGLSEKDKLSLTAFSDLPTKARRAKERGAKGIIYVSGPNSGTGNDLIALSKMGSDAGILAINVSDAVAQNWLTAKDPNLKLKDIQSQYDAGKDYKLTLSVKLKGNVDLQHKKGQGRNVLARLQVGNYPTASYVMVGAHIDHLGHGETSTSRADKTVQGQAHVGADDNASGVAAMIEMARLISTTPSLKELLKKDIVFAAWSGEELGLLGSSSFVNGFKTDNLQGRIEAYLNLDMVGRLKENLYLQGVGSSQGWRSIIENSVSNAQLPVYLQEDPYLPTDVLKFYIAKVPVISAFTGSHADYHTPGDTPDKINYDGLSQIAAVYSQITARTSGNPKKLVYEKVTGGSGITTRAGFRITLGTMPDYTQSDAIKGVKLSGVISASPADRAGVKANDIVLELAGRKVSNINEYADLLRILKPGQEIDIKVKRGEDVLSLKLTPEAHK